MQERLICTFLYQLKVLGEHRSLLFGSCVHDNSHFLFCLSLDICFYYCIDVFPLPGKLESVVVNYVDYLSVARACAFLCKNCGCNCTELSSETTGARVSYFGFKAVCLKAFEGRGISFFSGQTRLTQNLPQVS